MKDILDQAVVILVEGDMDVTFRGTVFPDQSSGFGPVPFWDTISKPVPEIPKVSIEGTKGVPFEEEFIIRLKVKNTNTLDILAGTL